MNIASIRNLEYEEVAISEFGLGDHILYPRLKDDSAFVPEKDDHYVFNKAVTEAILAGFLHNKKVFIQGLHGTGKSTHIEQVAARLNWPCIRVNLDGNLSRGDFIGRDYITIKDNKQLLEFREGILPWAITRPMALILDEYDAARPEFLFILQRLLEDNGKLVLIEENKVIEPHPQFRLFATSNTLGHGDYLGIYYGTNYLNQAQLDRWHIAINLDYLDVETEKNIVLSKVKDILQFIDQDSLDKYFELFSLIRNAFKIGEISFALSPRAIIIWAENTIIFSNPQKSFLLSFVNKLPIEEKNLIAEFYQRIFAAELFT